MKTKRELIQENLWSYIVEYSLDANEETGQKILEQILEMKINQILEELKNKENTN